MEECCGINIEQEMTIENLYCFIRASLQALQSTGGYGEADFVCPLCGKKAHIKRLKGELYNTGEIGCRCGYSFTLVAIIFIISHHLHLCTYLVPALIGSFIHQSCIMA